MFFGNCQSLMTCCFCGNYLVWHGFGCDDSRRCFWSWTIVQCHQPRWLRARPSLPFPDHTGPYKLYQPFCFRFVQDDWQCNATSKRCWQLSMPFQILLQWGLCLQYVAPHSEQIYVVCTWVFRKCECNFYNLANCKSQQP